MFQMTVVHPACSWIYHTLLKDFAITIKIRKGISWMVVLRVQVSGSVSKWRLVMSGVPQG